MAADDPGGDPAPDVEAGSEASRAAGRLRTAYDPWFGPLLGLGLLVQLVGLVTSPVVAFSGLAFSAVVDLSTSGEDNVFRGRLRRVGLGVLQRTTLRAVLMLAAVAAFHDEVSVLVASTYALGVVAVAVATRAVQFLLGKILSFRSAEGINGLGAGLDLDGFYPRIAALRPRINGWTCATEFPLATGFVLAASGARVPGVAVMAVTVAVLVAAVAAAALFTRRFLHSGRAERYLEELADAVRGTGAQIVVYFSGDREATYQLNQWMGVFEQLDRPLLFVLRERGHLDRMPATKWPILICRRHADVEVALAVDPKVVLYVGTAGKNIHFLRYGRPRHVFLNHGDSDKVSSANPVVKVYDELFVAGQVGIDRYRAAGIDLPDDRFRIVGRPQLDRVLDARRRIGEGPPTLLYAPTWEGYFDSADYSSLERMGPALIERLLTAHPQLRIVFKPHPTSGLVRAGARRAQQRVVSLLRDAGAPHVLAADHPELDLLAWFDRSDVLLSDVSAVVTDFLQTDKPYLVTNPRGLPLEQFHTLFPSHRAALVVAHDLTGFDEQVLDAFGADTMAHDRAQMKLAVLGEHPHGPLASFDAALGDAVARAARDADRRVNTFSYE